MATEVNTTIERFEVDASNAIAGASALAKAERDLGDAFVAKDAKAKTTLESVSKMKEGMGRARETAMFFSQSLQGFGPSGQIAQQAVSGVVGALIGGGGILFALSAAQVAVKLFVQHQEEMKKAAEASRKELIALADEAARLGETTGRSAVAAAQVGFLQRQVAELTKRRDKLIADGDEDEAEKLDEEIRRLDRKRTEIAMHIGALRVAEGEAASRERREHAKAEKAEAEAKAAKAEAERKARAAKLAAEGKEEGLGIAARGAGFAGSQNAAEEQYRRNAAALREWADVAIDTSIDLQTAMEIGMLSIPSPPEDPYIRMMRERAEAAKVTTAHHQAFTDLLADSGADMARSAVAMFRPLMTGSKAYSDAMRAAGGAAEDSADLSAAAMAAMTQDVLAALAEQAAVKSLMEAAEGLAALANPVTASTAPQHFAAAAAFAGVAALAGASAYAIGQNRGMTAAERSQVEAYKASVAEEDSSYLGGAGKSGETVTIREQPIVIAHPFMTRADAAAYAAQTIEDAYRLDLLRREG